MIALCLAAALQAKSNWGLLSETLQGTSNGHRYRIDIECANFEPRGRRIGWIYRYQVYFPAMNGRRLWESDGWSREETRRENVVDYLKRNTVEIKRFEVSVDGRKWRVPSSLTFDLLNLDLNGASPNDQHGVAWLSKDGSRLVLKQDGSDGGGGYCAYFVFHRHGPVERRIYIDSIVADKRKG